MGAVGGGSYKQLLPLAQLRACFISLLTVAAVLAMSGVDGAVVDGQPCHVCEKQTRLGRCDMHCVCRNGRWRCCRLRKDFTRMTVDEVNLYNAILLRARTNPRLNRLYKELVKKHEDLAARIHKWPYFFPWHRYWILRFETALRHFMDCRLTLPYFDFTKHWRDWWAHSPFDSLHLGGNGEGRNCCVQTGPFREGKWNVTAMKGGGCLKRYFNKAALMPSPRVISILIGLYKAEQFPMVAKVVNHWVHNLVHNSVGGYFFLFQAANDPTFWVLHSYLDKLWSTWQQRGAKFLKYPYASMKKISMPGTPAGVDHTLADFYDMENLPGNVRICYASGDSMMESIVKDFAGPEIPRPSLRSLDSRQVRDMIEQLDKDELVQLSYTLGLMSDRVPTRLIYNRLPGDCVQLNAHF